MCVWGVGVGGVCVGAWVCVGACAQGELLRKTDLLFSVRIVKIYHHIYMPDI